MADHKKARSPCGEAQLGTKSGALDGLKAMLADERPFEIREDHIQSLLLARRARDELLGEDLFSDPAWDLLLHLYVESAAGKQVAISGLCSAAKVRPTTGLRWINLLVDAGLLEKSDDPEDARIVFVGFATGADESIHHILARAMAESTAEPPAEVA